MMRVACRLGSRRLSMIGRLPVRRLFSDKPGKDGDDEQAGFSRFKRQSNTDGQSDEMKKADDKVEDESKKTKFKEHSTIEELKREIEEQFKESQKKIQESKAELKENDEKEQSPKDYDFWKKRPDKKDNEKEEGDKKKEPMLNWFRSKEKPGTLKFTLRRRHKSQCQSNSI
jgi:hypothetical protein